MTGSTKDGVQSETVSESKLFLHVSSLSQQWKANTTEAHIFFIRSTLILVHMIDYTWLLYRLVKDSSLLE